MSHRPGETHVKTRYQKQATVNTWRKKQMQGGRDKKARDTMKALYPESVRKRYQATASADRRLYVYYS
jgi:hypothetical protein